MSLLRDTMGTILLVRLVPFELLLRRALHRIRPESSFRRSLDFLCGLCILSLSLVQPSSSFIPWSS